MPPINRKMTLAGMTKLLEHTTALDVRKIFQGRVAA